MINFLRGKNKIKVLHKKTCIFIINMIKYIRLYYKGFTIITVYDNYK